MTDAPTGSGGQPAIISKRVLIVDDEYGLAEVVSEMLTDAGHMVDTAMNGIAALDRMVRHKPDLVLLDLMMPLLDGPGVLRRMRAEAGLADIPVVLMTAVPRAIPDGIASMYQGLLVKPFTPDALLAAVGRLG